MDQALERPVDELPAAPQGRNSLRRFTARVLTVAAVSALLVALYLLSDLLLLVFASALVAAVLDTIARPLARVAGLPHWLSLLMAVAAVALVIAGAVFLVSSRMGTELADVLARIPVAFEAVSRELSLGSFAEIVRGSRLPGVVASALSWGTSIVGAVASFILVIVAGIYLAADPRRYRDGVLALMPDDMRPPVGRALSEASRSLGLWFRVQLLAMVLVGLLTAAGLWLVGVPSALALGLIAGLTEFIPIIGPILGAVPALLIASTQGPEQTLMVLGVVLAVQQIENNLILPLVVGRAVALAPVVGLFAVVAFGVLFGPLGLLLGYPLAVVTDVAIREMWLRPSSAGGRVP